MKIYLAGIISEKEIDLCRAWRSQIIDHYSNWKNSGKNYGDVCFLNPLNGEDNISGLTSNIPPSAIFIKDYNAIRISNLFIVNMDNFGSDRVNVGTILEIAFAYEAKLPILMITTDDMHKQHPFLSTMVNCYFTSVEELLEKKIINTFYKAFNSSY
ncbi:MAG: hypothetical protein M0R17_03230 [Candidatus Omnitrophica bacterium]|jgi:nucleoside 2-deoxyribosyltransferase|nr:hypothetical protein [Candidatus Omnitrophota bacterium]